MSHRIHSASAGFIVEHYDGSKTGPYSARWKAELVMLWKGCGWYVRELRVPLTVEVMS